MTSSARPDNGVNGAEQSLRGAVADSHFVMRINDSPIQCCHFRGDGLPQRRDPRHRRVLIGATTQVVLYPVEQCVGWIETRKNPGTD